MAKMAGLTHGELNGIGPRLHDGLHGLSHVFDAGQKPGLVEETVINGDVETAVGSAIKEAILAV